MEHKNAFWISLALATCFVGTPVIVYAGQQNNVSPPPTQQEDNLALKVTDPDRWIAQRTIPGPYRLTYTVTELDGKNRVGTQRYAIVLDAGSEIPSAALRLGSKVPIETGKASSASETEITYIDIGLTIDASLRLYKNGLELRSHIVQSAIDTLLPPPSTPPSPLPPPGPAPSPTRPVIRATDLKSSVLLNENKPVTIGNVDMPGTTHILQIQVEVSKLP